VRALVPAFPRRPLPLVPFLTKVIRATNIVLRWELLAIRAIISVDVDGVVTPRPVSISPFLPACTFTTAQTASHLECAQVVWPLRVVSGALTLNLARLFKEARVLLPTTAMLIAVFSLIVRLASAKKVADGVTIL